LFVQNEELVAARQGFLSQMIFQTFNGYAMSQFKKIEQDIRNHGDVRWKHAMHLLRLLLPGAATLRDARVPVRVEAHRDRLLAVKRGELPWAEVDAWRKELHRDFERALAGTKLPDRPDYEAADTFLIRARRSVSSFADLASKWKRKSSNVLKLKERGFLKYVSASRHRPSAGCSRKPKSGPTQTVYSVILTVTSYPAP
jgi:hypothetical protein